MSQVNSSVSHDVVRGRVPEPGESNEMQNDTLRIAEYGRTKPTAATGYVDANHVPEVSGEFGSGSEWYGEHWDSGFAQEGDPYGIKAEYIAQSASPNAALPTQEDADRIKAESEAID